MQPITGCDCEECLEIRANLGHLRWNDVLAPAVDKCFGALPLLTDEAFHALLPAFLFRALQDVSRENKYLEWTLYSLCGAYQEDEGETEASAAKLRERIANFTPAQRAAVRALLELVRTEPSLESHHEPIAYALPAIWS